MKVNKNDYIDRVYACWKGKNIGGTMGAPFEGKCEMQNISGFTTEKGAPLPNDDLDLQLLWLCAVEERGIKSITPRMLGEYWVSFVPPQWNEYGTGKANMKIGLLPPFSGEYNNEQWKHSNGAWIRTEIWACLFPGYPELAVKYSYRDACIDHGLGEGTYAAMFMAALESKAFVESDVQKLIETGLSYIPEDCRIAKSVRLAVELYNNKATIKDARDKIVEFTKDLGWFQAPANISFVILGILYGEGDFKKSMITAINCGDDTDCTGATVGALMGIMYGDKIIPKDWAEYIGDSIVSNALDLSYWRRPSSCTELTRRVMEIMPSSMKAYGLYVELCDEETNLNEEIDYRITELDIPTNPYTYDVFDLIHTQVRVEFEEAPIAKCGGTMKMKATLINSFWDPRNLSMKLHLPDGWTADYRRTVYVPHFSMGIPTLPTSWEADIIVGENIEAVNKIYLEIETPGRPTSGMLPLVILG